ncbi:MAG: prepilin-type N-terminal cleavage/methylation domain-containing protein [Desulfobacteraceae bacterium]|nr:prepilin-type N-terminal cleavage/methylation domain-containing protein [Desulfobacteraceae bacterium]
MTLRKKSALSSDAGFTLLEIIAVLVILSILAVVAVPKYFDLQTQARTNAMNTAMAEAIGRVNSYFASQVLSGVLPQNIQYTTTTVGGDPATIPPGQYNMGDFELTVVGVTGTEITLRVTPHATAFTGTAPLERTIPIPGMPTGPTPTPGP